LKLEDGTSEKAVDALASRDFAAYEEVTKPYENSEVEDQLWAEIAGAHPIRFDVFECLMAWSVDTEGARSSRRFLLPVAGHVQGASVDDVLRLLDYTHVLGISYLHFVAQQLTELLKRDATLCVPVGEALATSPYSESAVPVWATTFAQAWPADAAKYVLVLAERGVGSTRFLAQLLRPIPAEDKGALDVLLPHAPAISKRLVEEAGNLGRDAWSALAAMAGYSVDAMDALLAAVRAGNEGAVSVLCVHLYRLDEPTVGASKIPLADVLHLLMAAVVSDHKLGHHVDSVMHLLFGRAGGKKTVVDELVKLADVPMAVADVFPDTFHAVSSDAEHLSTLVTTWLVSESFEFAPLNSALSFMWSRELGFKLDTTVFSAAAVEMKVKSAHRMLVGCHNGSLLCQFVAALVEPVELQPVGLEIAVGFMNLLLREYPQSSRAFLDGKVRVGDRTTPHAKFYAKALKVAKQQAAVYESLPALKELQPSVSERLAMGAMRSRRSRDIGRKSDEGSIFASIFQKTHIAQGNGFLATTSHAGQQVVPFNHFNYSMELPISHFSDPVGAWMMRHSRAEEAK
jgi:hypothetical protein